MAYSYFTKELLRKNIDLGSISSEQQQRAKDINSVSYGLPEIVMWLKDSTNDFKKTDYSFIDIDRAIQRIVYKHYETSNEPNPFTSVSDAVKETISEPRKPVEIGGDSKDKDKLKQISDKDDLKAKLLSDIEEMQMLIELTQDTLKENPNDEDLPMYLELLNDTLKEIMEKQKELL